MLQKFFFLFITAFLFSCAKSEKNDLKEAQLCLNGASTSQAMACVDKISSDTSAQAYKLRCAAVFISEGFNTPTAFINALDKINNATGSCTGGCSSTVGAISALSFSKSSTDGTRSNAVADLAFNYCSLSDTPIYMQISSIFKLGTMAANLTGVNSPTEDQIKAAIGSLPASSVGDLVIATYNGTCQNVDKASDAIKKYCSELGVGVNAAGANATTIGTCLINKLQNPSYTSATCP